MKDRSLFSMGMLPAVLSRKAKELAGGKWTRGGFDVSY